MDLHMTIYTNASAGRNITGADLVRCVMFLNTAIRRDCLPRVPGKPSIHIMKLRLTYILEPQEPYPQAVNLLFPGSLVAWYLRAPF